MTELYPGLRRAAEICWELARQCDAKIDAAPSPYTAANVRRKAEGRALRRAASRITDEMLAEPIASPLQPVQEAI